ncbi:unnamed protein product [Oreochromis niloticus]|nr:unnamed protein product [Mustela putorius furo]
MRRKTSSRSIFRDLYDVIERQRREGRPWLIQLESLTRRSRTLTLLFQSTLQTRLLASTRDDKTITAESGQDVTLTCRAPNNNIRHDQHPSFKNRVDLQDRQMKDGDVSLILKDVTINNAETYECAVYMEETHSWELISIIYLRVSPGDKPDRMTRPVPQRHAVDSADSDLFEWQDAALSIWAEKLRGKQRLFSEREHVFEGTRLALGGPRRRRGSPPAASPALEHSPRRVGVTGRASAAHSPAAPLLARPPAVLLTGSSTSPLHSGYASHLGSTEAPVPDARLCTPPASSSRRKRHTRRHNMDYFQQLPAVSPSDCFPPSFDSSLKTTNKPIADSWDVSLLEDSVDWEDLFCSPKDFPGPEATASRASCELSRSSARGFHTRWPGRSSARGFRAYWPSLRSCCSVTAGSHAVAWSSLGSSFRFAWSSLSFSFCFAGFCFAWPSFCFARFSFCLCISLTWSCGCHAVTQAMFWTSSPARPPTGPAQWPPPSSSRPPTGTVSAQPLATWPPN